MWTVGMSCTKSVLQLCKGGCFWMEKISMQWEWHYKRLFKRLMQNYWIGKQVCCMDENPSKPIWSQHHCLCCTTTLKFNLGFILWRLDMNGEDESGSTATALFIGNDVLFISHVGDSCVVRIVFFLHFHGWPCFCATETVTTFHYAFYYYYAYYDFKLQFLPFNELLDAGSLSFGKSGSTD